MNLFEQQLAMYEARVKKIEANPSSKRMASNKLRYEIQAEHNREMLRYWQEGRQFGHIDLADRVLDAMGIIPLHLERASDSMAKYSPEYVDLATSHGFPADVCTRIRAGVGMCLSEHFPPPAVVVTEAQICDSRVPRSAFIARHFGAPLFVFDKPPDEEDDEALEYLTGQYWDLVHLLEDVAGKKFDEEKLREIQDKGLRSHGFVKEMEEAQRSVPCVISGKDSLRGAPRDGDNPKEKEYAQLVLSELRNKVAKGFAAVGEEKLRVAWLVSAPLYADPFSPLEKLGVAFPLCEIGGRSGRAEKAMTEEYWEHWRTDSPLAREARVRLGHTWHGKAETRVRNVLNQCREYKIDAVVHFNQWGCRQNNLSAKIMADRLEEELGIPTLIIEGDNTDPRNFNEAGFMAQLEEFVTMCIMMKGMS